MADIEMASVASDESVSEETSQHHSIAMIDSFNNDSNNDSQSSTSVEEVSLRPTRRIEAPRDIYTSVNFPEIETLVQFDDAETYQKSITFSGPLPLGIQLTEVRKNFQNYHVSEESLNERFTQILCPVTNEPILYHKRDGWYDVATDVQIYDNKGNKATDDVDFQISRVKKCEEANKFHVEFADWKSLLPMVMSYNDLTRNGSNKFMVSFLKYIRNYVAVGKWMTLGGRKKRKVINIATQGTTQRRLKALVAANNKAQNDKLSTFVQQEYPLIVKTDATGCLIASVINVLRLNSWDQFSDALDSIMSMEMLSRYCQEKVLCRLKEIKESPVDYLVTRCAEVEVNADENMNELELYILFDSNICHCISIDLRRKIIYDSASDNVYPYFFNAEVLCLLGFTSNDSYLQLRRLTNVGREYSKQVKKNHKRKIHSIV